MNTTPEQVAESLIGRMSGTKEQAKYNALVCVVEVIKIIDTMPPDISIHYLNHWQQVKTTLTNK